MSDVFDFDSTPRNALREEYDEEMMLVYIRIGVETWRLVYFEPADLADQTKEATLWYNDADPDLEGLENLWKYFMGFNPLTNDLVGFELLDAKLVEGDLLVTYGRSSDFRLYAHEVPESRDDLSAWLECGGGPSVVEDYGDHLILERTIQLTDEEILLIRLRYFEECNPSLEFCRKIRQDSLSHCRAAVRSFRRLYR